MRAFIIAIGLLLCGVNYANATAANKWVESADSSCDDRKLTTTVTRAKPGHHYCYLADVDGEISATLDVADCSVDSFLQAPDITGSVTSAYTGNTLGSLVLGTTTITKAYDLLRIYPTVYLQAKASTLGGDLTKFVQYSCGR